MLAGLEPPSVNFPSVLLKEKGDELCGCVLSAMVMVPKFGFTVTVTVAGALCD